MADAMDRFLSHPEKKKELVEKGLSRVREFSWEKTGESVHSAYLEFAPAAPAKKESAVPKGESPEGIAPKDEAESKNAE